MCSFVLRFTYRRLQASVQALDDLKLTSGIVSFEFLNINTNIMEMKILIQKFSEWLHGAFIPSNQHGIWIRRDHSETLDSSQLQEKFLQERPEFRSLWEKAGLLALLVFALSTGIVIPLSATRPPVKVQQDSVKRDSQLAPIAFKMIKWKQYPLKSNKKP